MSTNKIFMEASFDISFKEPVSEMIKKSVIGIIGGFDFVIEEKSFPFDFESWSAKITGMNQENNTLSIDYFSGYGGMIECDSIDFDTYEKYYEEAGFDKDYITAGLLASTSEISEFHISMTKEGLLDDELIDHIKITDICFIDEDMIRYYVSKPIIDNFNSREKQK